MKILHISDKRIGDKNFISGIKTVLLEELKYENKIQGTISKILLLKKSNEQNNIYIFDKDINKKILEFKPDFIIFDGFWCLKHCFIAKLLKKNKIKYYIKPHGCFNKIAQKNSKIKFLKKIIAKILFFDNYVKNSSGLIFLNEMEKENSIYRKNHEFILPNGIEKIDIKHKKIKQIKENINFIFLGRIDIFNKKLDVLFDTLIKNKIYFIKNNIYFNFYGTGNNQNMRIFNRYLTSVPEFVKYHGTVYGNKKYKELQKNNVFILLSRFEGMPMGILESLSTGTPCFISKETGMGEFIEKNNAGWVSKKEEDLFKVLKKCIENIRNNFEYYKNNSLKSAKQFYWENIIEIYRIEYQRMKKECQGF